MLTKLERDPVINLQTKAKECQRLIDLKRDTCQTENPEKILKISGQAVKITEKK